MYQEMYEVLTYIIHVTHTYINMVKTLYEIIIFSFENPFYRRGSWDSEKKIT